MGKLVNRTSLFTLVIGVFIGVVFCVGVFIGNTTTLFSQKETVVTHDQPQRLTPELALKASSASGGKKISLATGLLIDGNECLFALDHITGDLFCWVLSPRLINVTTPTFHAEYVTNVRTELELEKGAQADFVMTTGNLDASSMPSSNNARPADCVCYVADGNTGRIGGFGFYLNGKLLSQKQQQSGSLVRIASAVTRTSQRD